MAVSLAKPFMLFVSAIYNKYYFAFGRGLTEVFTEFGECAADGLFVQLADLATDGCASFGAEVFRQLFERLLQAEG